MNSQKLCSMKSKLKMKNLAESFLRSLSALQELEKLFAQQLVFRQRQVPSKEHHSIRKKPTFRRSWPSLQTRLVGLVFGLPS